MINESRSTRSPYSRTHRILAVITIVAVLGGGAMVMNQNSPLANNDLLAQANRVPEKQDTEQDTEQASVPSVEPADEIPEAEAEAGENVDEVESGTADEEIADN